MERPFAPQYPHHTKQTFGGNKMNETKKQGWMLRLVTAVFEKLFSAICASDMGISPAASQEFFYYSGYGWEEAIMYQSMVRAKLHEEQI
jgi:hypothetical protein